MTITQSDIKRRVLQAMPLPPAWATPKQVYKKMHVGAYATVKIALHSLHQEGILAKFGPVTDPCYCRLDLIPAPYVPLVVGNVAAFPDIKKAEADYQARLRQWKVGK